MSAKRKVAVFDVDGTIFRSSLFIEVVERLVQKGIFPHDAREEYEKEYKKWLDREGGYEYYLNAMIKSFNTHIKGVYYGDFADTAREVVAEQNKHTYKYTRDLIQKLKKEGYYILAISHSPKTVLDYFCPQLGFDKAYGIILEIGPEDCFTGKIAEEHIIFNKAQTLKRALEKGNLTLEGSYGVGDTESDIMFLEKVEHPICFNPNTQLYRHAKIQNWPVVVERKDVVYEL